MKKYALIVSLLLAVFCFGWFFTRRFSPSAGNTVTISGKTLQVEIARTDAQREQGLSDRQFLCENCGMLFIFDSPGFQGFWMKRMHFDIDMIWINGNKIVDITHSAKKPEASEFDSPKTIYTSKVPADKILEVNAGWAEKNGVKVGDEIKTR